jgi:hypothetical protein
MRLIGLRSVVCRLACRLSGYLQRPRGHPLRHPVRAVRTDRPPIREDRVHSPVSVSPLRSVFAAPSGRPFQVGATLPEFRPSPRHHRWCPRPRELPPPATFRPRVFSTPRRLAPPFGFAGLLHPAATPRVCSVQGFLPIRSRPRLVAGPCPLAVVIRSLTGKPAATSGLLGLEALLRASMRSSEQAVTPPRRSLPSSVFAPPSGRRLPPRARFPVPSARDVSAPGLFSSP